MLVSLWVVSWRNLDNRIHHHIEIWLVLFQAIIKLFVDSVQSSRVDFGDDNGVLFVPALEDLLKIWASFVHLLENIARTFFVQVKFDSEGSHQQIENDALII